MPKRTELPSWARQTAEIAILAAVYFGAARLGLAINSVYGFATLVWPPTGISIAALLIFGYRLWPGVLLGAFLANATVGAPIPVALSIGIGNMLEAVLAVYLFRQGRFDDSLGRLRDVFGFVVCCSLFSTAVSPTIGVTSLWVIGRIPPHAFGYTWTTWWIGDAIGALVFCPLITAWLRSPRERLLSSRRLEAALLLVVLTAVAMVNFGDWFHPMLARYIRPYYIFPVLIWAALRFGQKGATTSTFLLSILAVLFEASGSGPFQGHTLEERLLALEMFMGVVALTTLFLAAASAERREAIESLKTARDELEDRVRVRTVQLSEVNRMLTEAQEQAHIGSWEWHIAGNRVTWSDELYAIYGFHRKEFEGTYEGFLTAVHPDDRERIKIRVEQSVRSGEPFAYDHRIVRPDGTIRIVHGEGKVIKSDAGIPERMAGTSQDITERWQAEEEVRKLNEELELRVRERTAELARANEALGHEIGERIQTEQTLLQSRELFRDLVENINEIYCILDLRGKLIYGSPNLYLRSGYAEEALAGRSFLRLIAPEDRRRVVDHYLARSADGTIDSTCEFRVLLKGGTMTWVEQSTRFIRDPEGAVIEYRNATHEISQRKKAEEKLHDAQMLLQSIIDNSIAVIYVKDVQGRFLLVNRRFEEIFHLTKESTLGKTDFDIFPPTMARQFRANDLQVLKLMEPLEWEEVAPHDDGPHTYISLKVPLRDNGGTPVAICGISTDITDRKRAEREISTSRERYRGFFENSPISLWEEDFSEVKRFVDGLRAEGVSDFALYFKTHPEAVAECATRVKVVDVNQASLHLYEARSKSDFLDGLQRVLSRESYHVFREELIAVAEGKTVFESEDVNKTFRGETINIYLKWSVPPGSEESYSTVLVSIVDMTVHKRAQEALIKFASIIESSDDAIVSQTTDGIITSWNRGAERVYGYPAEEMIGRPISALIPEDHPDDLRQILDTIKRGEALEHYETECLHKDGRRIVLSLTVSPIREEAGWISGASTIGRDITQQKQTEKQIRLLAQALESTTEMITITNLENRIIFANRAFLDKYGYEEKEILGKFPDVVRSLHTSPQLARQIFEHTRRRGWAGELLNRTKDGRDFPVFLSTSQIRDGKGAVLGLIGVARDISEIAKAEEVLWQSAVRIERLFDTGSEERLASAKGYERLGTDPARRRHDLARDINEVVEKIRARAQRTLSFSSMASHQLRTPLTILRSQLENALRPDLSSQALRRALSETYDEVLHLTRVVDELLNLSRMQAGTFKLDLTDINFYDLLRDFYHESQILTREKKINMVLRKGPPVSIRADPSQMRHILFNLLDNAIKFTPTNGRIRLSYTAEEHELVFKFFNSGKGISSEILPNIFDPFRSGQSESSMGGGTGLGLALVKWIVESHRGSVEARNDAREGTAFLIRLPIHPGS